MFNQSSFHDSLNRIAHQPLKGNQNWWKSRMANPCTYR